MIKRIDLKSLAFLFFILSFLMLGQSVLADECLLGQTRTCGTCGIQKCECEEEEVNIGTEEFPNIITVTVCDWGSCNEAGNKPDSKQTEYWDEFRCQGSGCAEEYIQKRDCSKYKTRSVTCQSGEWKTGSWSSWSQADCDEPSVYEDCDLDWQLCSGSTGWTQTKPSCNCSKECLEAPKNPRYYNDPDYPIDPYQPEKSENADNIFLPVKLDWDNIKGWKDGWKAGEEIKECTEDCVQSYSIEIDNTSQGNFSKSLINSEYNPSTDQGACFLKSETTHNWRVSACCNADGTECGPESSWSFSTNSAPEPSNPLDPDWKTKEEKAEGIGTPVLLDWCDVDAAESYRIRLYYIENEQEVCHPWLGSESICSSKVIKTEKRPPPYPSEEILYSNFRDTEGYFTKDTEYTWELTTCGYENGTDCGDFGQKWSFKTASVSLGEFGLISPQNDPTGNVPLGLPLTLDWEAKTGMNSFIYEINPGNITGIATSSQTSLDYPALSLDAYYKWKIKPCWDYAGKECEEEWSEEWTFKTTGAPPETIYPKSGSKNIPIPIQLEWQSVSGAKSYKYWLFDAGKNLVISNTTNEAKGMIEYDSISEKIKQESSCYWQVATCVDTKGKICGERSGLQSFTTFRLSAPSNLSPESKIIVYTYQLPISLSWNSDAKYFKITINYVEKSLEESKNCPTESNSYNLQGSFYPFNFDCLGKYTWQIQACLNKDCSEKGDVATSELSLEQTVPPDEFGLVPCGRSSDNPNTPWNERESCQIKHLFILFRNILDLLLWRVSLIVLLLLTVATAGIYYMSIGRTDVIMDVKELWRSAGKGFAIIFLAWIFISLFLNFLGYRVGIFGNWWQIKF